MAIENFLSNEFWSTFVDSINVFDYRLSSVKILGNVKYVFSPIVYTNITEECYFSQMYIAFDRFHSAIYYGLLQSEQGADPDIQCIR